MTNIIYPPRRNRIYMAIFGGVVMLGLLGIAVLPWFAQRGSFVENLIITSLFGSVAFLFGLYVTVTVTTHAELSDTQITRRSIFRAKSLLLGEIDSARYTSAKGTTILKLRSSHLRRSIMFSTQAFSYDQLKEIERFLLSEAGKASRTVATDQPITMKEAIAFTMVQLLLIILVFGVITIAGIHNIHLRQAAHTTNVK